MIPFLSDACKDANDGARGCSYCYMMRSNEKGKFAILQAWENQYGDVKEHIFSIYRIKVIQGGYSNTDVETYVSELRKSLSLE